MLRIFCFSCEVCHLFFDRRGDSIFRTREGLIFAGQRDRKVSRYLRDYRRRVLPTGCRLLFVPVGFHQLFQVCPSWYKRFFQALRILQLFCRREIARVQYQLCLNYLSGLRYFECAGSWRLVLYF